MATYIHGIGASENIDSSGEIVSIAGLDISSLDKDGVFNWEHKADQPAQVVGKILKARKIFTDADCEDDHQLYFWNKCKVPYLYVMGELTDDYTDSAREVAGKFRYDADKKNQNERPMMNFSVEGSKISKEGIVVTRSIARKITITILPCNKVAIAEMVAVEPAKPKKSEIDELFKTEAVEIEVFTPDEKMWNLLKKEDPNKHAAKLGIKPFQKDAFGTQAPSQVSGSAIAGGMGSIGPTSSGGVIGGEGMMRSEMEKGQNNIQESPHPQSKHKGNLDVSRQKGINKPVSGGPIGESTSNPNTIREAGGNAKATHSATLGEIRSMPKPNLPKSESEMKKAAPAAPHQRGNPIGKTKSGQDVYSHGMIGEYTHFSPQEHKEAADIHQAQATKLNSAGKFKEATHHHQKAQLHQQRFKTLAIDKPAARANVPSKGPAVPSSGPHITQLYDPQMSGKVDYKHPKVGKSEKLDKALDAGSALASPANLSGGAALGKEDLDKSAATTVMMNKDAANPKLAPKDVKVKKLQAQIDAGTYKPDSKKIADAMKIHPEQPLKKATAKPANPKDPVLSPGAEKPASQEYKQRAEAYLKKPKAPKSNWLMRAEDTYQHWEKREAFESFMQNRMPHLTKTEVKVIGQTMLMHKAIELEKSLNKLSKDFYDPSVLRGSEKK